ncbi:ribonuclease MC-like [Benincasa hispida]|uniref:ribonuclease MC-like n=1 Tax=Benincasa hispida TaxID=102211 RepID=UPI0018FF1727|nr:ribonuclease MC-like [Benincasa hispida]
MCEGVNEYDFLRVVFQWQPATCGVATKPYPYCYQTPQNRFGLDYTMAKPNVQASSSQVNLLFYPKAHFVQTSKQLTRARAHITLVLFKGRENYKVKVLEPRLNEMWGNVITGDNQWLWKPEWDKHGTCIEDILFDQSGYFEYTMNTLYYFNPEEILKNGGIWPTQEGYYTLDEIKSVIKARTGKLPAVGCNYNHWTSYQQLHEISYCVTKEGQTFVDCPSNANKCNGHSAMWYPPPY